MVTSILFAALSKIPYGVGRGEMNAKTWNALKAKVMAANGPNIDWWGVRIAVNKVMTRNKLVVVSPEEAFNFAYQMTPLPYRKNNLDGTPTARVILEHAAAFIVLLVIVLAVYASMVFVIMIMTALILGGISAVASFIGRR